MYSRCDWGKYKLKKLYYVVVIACVFKFMYCVAIIFMMQKLISMGILIHPNLDHLDIVDKVVEKVIMDGAIIKNSYSPPIT